MVSVRTHLTRSEMSMDPTHIPVNTPLARALSPAGGLRQHALECDGPRHDAVCAADSTAHDANNRNRSADGEPGSAE